MTILKDFLAMHRRLRRRLSQFTGEFEIGATAMHLYAMRKEYSHEEIVKRRAKWRKNRFQQASEEED